MTADHHVHHKSSNPEDLVHSKCSANSSASDFMNRSVNSPEQQNSASSVSAAGSSVQTDERCDVKTEMTDRLSLDLNLFSANQGSSPEELEILVNHPDSRKKTFLHSDPSENAKAPEQGNKDPGVETSTSVDVSSPAFDPGGPGISRRDEACVDSEGNSHHLDHIMSVELISQNTNNNNLHTLNPHNSLKNIPKCVFRPKDQKPDACCEGQISETASFLMKTSASHGAMENPEVEVDHVDCALTRHVCRSLVLQQLEICTREMTDFLTSVVLDTGSSLVKAGFADQDLPTTIFPTAVGLPKYMEVMSGSEERGVYVGHDAQHMRGVLTLHYPMRSGVVSDWEQMEMLLMEQGVCMRTSAELEIVREMKESCCCVAVNYGMALRGGDPAGAAVRYTLPDGQLVSLTTERFRAPEILFKPELIGQDYYGMHESIFRSVVRSDVDLRRDLMRNIVLSGGNTLLCGLSERLRSEISGLAPVCLGECVKVISSGDREFSVWRGGAVVASMPTFSSAWISQQEYDEFGPQIVFRKCF
ncbi:actin [Bagarius yarrelli]|uniref:Actin n=1 Tax=Bagarius yarrelli TaxID=175774 RepID=A0A556VWK6_BAGYA|nr:actin [Bagarius yarrelli]